MDALPSELIAFIRDEIDSVGDLEALLLLHRADPARWNGADLAKRLYITEEQAEAILARLVAHRLAMADGEGFVLDRTVPELVQRVGELARFYATHLIPISNIIHSKAPTRIQQFADAFNFKRRK